VGSSVKPDLKLSLAVLIVNVSDGMIMRGLTWDGPRILRPGMAMQTGHGGRYRDVPELPESDRSARVVGVGAWCEFGASGPAGDRTQGFAISEFVMLENGRRVILHQERGVAVATSGQVLLGIL
jgi:hypothetical protein